MKKDKRWAKLGRTTIKRIKWAQRWSSNKSAKKDYKVNTNILLAMMKSKHKPMKDTDTIINEHETLIC